MKLSLATISLCSVNKEKRRLDYFPGKDEGISKYSEHTISFSSLWKSHSNQIQDKGRRLQWAKPFFRWKQFY